MSRKKITVETKGGEVDFEDLRKRFTEEKENEINQLNRIYKDRGKNIMQRPLETAQQKATKRANKLLDSKRQQQVEKIAAEKLGNHEKRCPICEHPFKDVNEFMAHLSKCNVFESSDDEEAPAKETIEKQRSTKPTETEEDISSIDYLTDSITQSQSSDNTKLKVRNNFITLIVE